MTSSQLFRISGSALVAGAVLFIVHLMARSVMTAGPDLATVAREGLWVPINTLGVIGAALVLLGLPAMFARIARPTGVLGLIGVVLIALAWMFFGVFLSLYSVLVVPWLAEKAPSLVSAAVSLPASIIIAFIIGLLAEFGGSVLLAIPFMRGRVQPRWVGPMLPAATILRVVGNFIAPSGPATNLAINLLSNLGPILLLATLGYIGSRMWLKHAAAGQAGEALERVAGSP